MPNKHKLYENLLERQQDAHDAGYYYEAIFFAYAIFEDRTRSIVKNSGDGSGYGRQLKEKLTTIKERWDATTAKLVQGKPVRTKGVKEKVPKWPRLRTLERELIVDVDNWRDNRNDLTHKLASGEIALCDADELAKGMSNEALELTNRICASARRVKKHQKKKLHK